MRPPRSACDRGARGRCVGAGGPACLVLVVAPAALLDRLFRAFWHERTRHPRSPRLIALRSVFKRRPRSPRTHLPHRLRTLPARCELRGRAERAVAGLATARASAAAPRAAQRVGSAERWPPQGKKRVAGAVAKGDAKEGKAAKGDPEKAKAKEETKAAKDAEKAKKAAVRLRPLALAHVVG